jgi:hypothetical protein
MCFLGIMIFLFAGQIFAGAVGVDLAALVAVTLAGSFLLIVLIEVGIFHRLVIGGESPACSVMRVIVRRMCRIGPKRLRSEDAAGNHQNEVGGA